MSKIHKLNACSIYILLWFFGHVQGLFISSSLISLAFYIPFLSMTLYYVIKTIVSYNLNEAMKVLSVFFSVLVCYGIALLILDNVTGVDKKSFLMTLFSSLGPIFAFFVFTKQGLLTELNMKKWLWLFVVTAIITFFVNRQNSIVLAIESGSRYEEITNNTAYSIAGLVPFVFLLRKKSVWQYIFLLIMFYFIITGLKRGAILSGAIMLLWFVYISVKTSSKGRKWGIILLTIVALVVGYQYIIQFYEKSDYFKFRVEATMEGRNSNRTEIYGTLSQHYQNNNNIVQLAFGQGAFYTQNITGTVKAHNDWLELLIDCGVVGVLLYLFFWVSFVKDWRKSKTNSLVYAMLGACFIFSFSRTFYSMSFNDMPFYTGMVIGYCFASINIKDVSLNSD